MIKLRGSEPPGPVAIRGALRRGENVAVIGHGDAGIHIAPIIRTLEDAIRCSV
jgi:hypothetical protein